MPSYLYGLILSRNAGRVPSDVTGIDRAPVRVVRCDGLSALVSTVEAPPSREQVESVVLHDRATSRVVRHSITAAASRFGQTFADDAALCAELATFASRLLSLLERYDGYGEMRVILRDVAAPAEPKRQTIPPPADASPGRAYLESIRERSRPEAPVDFRRIVGDLMLDERVERWKDSVQVVSHLVRFDDEAKYRIALYTHAALEGATITGPHALHAFAEPAT